MKKVVLLLILCLNIVFSAAADIAATMVSYEQSWLDSRGTLALRNNTDEEIKDVQFRITYLDMNDNPMDYEDYSRRVTIAPGMVRKVDIPAYEHDRFYHYYRTPEPLGNPTFKIRFKLLSHNQTVVKPKKAEPAVAEPKMVEKSVQPKEVQPIVAEPKVAEKVIEKTKAPKEKKVILKTKAKDEETLVSVAENDEVETTETEPVVEKEKESQPIVYKEENEDFSLVKDFLRLFLFGVSAGLFAIVGEMARKRNRNAIGWIVLSMFFTPFLMILILLFIGENKKDYYYRP